MRKNIFSALLMLFGFSTFLGAQSSNISGTILTKEDLEPVIGATVMVVGTSTGTTTDLDGRYELSVPGPESVLQVSYTGMKTMEETVGTSSKVDFFLENNVSLLDEVVVVGYGTQERSKITGSVSVISAEDINEAPITRIEQALQGRSAGVQVNQNSGSPGSPLTVRIRGIGTLQNGDPLYIVDGIPVDGVDFLNPSDIESMSVLKDAASSSIYGTRAANGVVLITTKTGKKMKEGRVGYQNYYGIQRPWKKMNLLNAREYAIIANESRVNAGKLPRPELSNPDILGEGTDWQNAVFESAPIFNHQLEFLGGTDKTGYAVGLSYFDQNGIVGGEKSGFQRYTLRAKTSSDLKPWLTIGNSINITSINRKFLAENNSFNSPLLRALNMDPITPVRKADGTYAYSQYVDTDLANPVNAIEQTNDTWNSKRFVGAFYAELKPLKGLSIRTTGSADITFAKRDKFFPIFDLSVDPVLSEAPGTEKSLTNSVVREDMTWQNLQWETVANYTLELADINRFVFTLGNTVIANTYEQLTGSNSNLPSNEPDQAYLANTIDPIISQGSGDDINKYTLRSFFGRVNYERDDKYFATASLRQDGSSRFGANNRFGYFPSFSLGWKVSSEEFWNFDPISSLKVRASWGQNGNDRFPNYRFTSVVRSGQNYSFDGDQDITNGSTPTEASNPDLKWETNQQTDIGIDLEMFDGKIYFVTDVYDRRTIGMIYNPPVPAIVGTGAPFTNVGEMQNRGWELALTYRNSIKSFKYNIGGNLTFLSTKVINLGDNAEPRVSGSVFPGGFASRTEVGQPVAAFYGYMTDGIFQDRQEIEAHAFQNENTAPGDIRFVDVDNNGVIDENDQAYIGNPSPKMLYGITADCSFKGFDMSLFLQGTQGNDIYNNTIRYDFAFTNRPQSILNRWTGPGTSTVNLE